MTAGSIELCPYDTPSTFPERYQTILYVHLRHKSTVKCLEERAPPNRTCMIGEQGTSGVIIPPRSCGTIPARHDGQRG